MRYVISSRRSRAPAASPFPVIPAILFLFTTRPRAAGLDIGAADSTAAGVVLTVIGLAVLKNGLDGI